jgi:DNA-binding CsgD family transcriptional regulator
MSTSIQVVDESLTALAANAMRKAAAAGAATSEGFILVDSTMNPIYASPEAARILMYPQKVEGQKHLGDFLAKKLLSLRFSEQSKGTSSVVLARFQSGRRQYFCRTFQLQGLDTGTSHGSVAILLERGLGRSLPIGGLSERFHLTTREQEVALLLLQGLTSKEIGVRMKISPHTVKAFIRLIMFKLGVSTRSGIVVKVLSSEG